MATSDLNLTLGVRITFVVALTTPDFSSLALVGLQSQTAVLGYFPGLW